MNKTSRNLLLLSTLLLFSFVANSQLLAPFKIRYQTFTKGDIMVISNNITNRTDNKNGSNIAYDDLANEANMNDEFEIQYIDIDNDSQTFSSSSATLNFEKAKDKKILYAALYWSATYKYNYGKVTKSGKYTHVDKQRDNDFDNIKFKLPGKEYIDIKGQIIYDGINEKQVEDFAPYIVYADVTDNLKNLEDPSGEYIVANIKATQGKLSGGVASGWTLFIVYEDPALTGKFITSFDGFAGVTEKSTDIVFNGFQTLPSGDINAKIACSAIEGDNTLTGDQLLFSTPESKTPIQLKNSLRKVNNFFNSSITVEEKYLDNRNPNSKNTLGFDTCVLSIPNLNNTVIGNNSTEATLKLKSSGDRYYMFFTAYSVEVVQPKGNLLATTTKKVVEKEKPLVVATLPEKAKVIKEQQISKPKAETVAQVQESTKIKTEPQIIKEEKLKPVLVQPEKKALVTTQSMADKPEKTEKPTVKETPVVAQTETRKEVKATIKSEVKPEIKSDIKTEVKQAMQAQKQDIKNEILSGLRDEIVSELKGEIIAEVKEEVKKEVKEEVKQEIKQELKAVVKKQLKDELRKELIPQTEVTDTPKQALTKKEFETPREEQKQIPVITQVEEKNIVEEEPVAQKSVAETVISNTTTSDILYERINTMSTGYYIIANVFAIKENANQFLKTLDKKGFKPKSFVNLQNNYTYVYLSKVETEEEARSLYNSKFNGKYTADMWILGVNKR